MKVRIGIDVGGTFTDAVVIDNDTYELLGSVKIPTTHEAKEGVAAGIVEVLDRVMKKCNVKPEDVTFIAHGTTQATNALLEGDVCPVGIITLGNGIQGMKAKSDTNIGDLELAAGKFLKTYNEFISTNDNSNFIGNIDKAINNLKAKGTKSIVATEAFSVDDPTNENLVMNQCSKNDIPCTAGNDVTKLYGLKVRTRTAVINASILPKMLEAANMTEKSIQNARIKAPLMVMRCDGGVMTVDEVRNRPILTILSGPAAGVAGALMYEKLTDGIFLEVGGTSTDISCVKDGNVVIKYAEVGGHNTYLNSLDVHTVGIGGGSMVQIVDGKAVDVGPRSAHIANLDYECYTNAEDIVNPVLKTIIPKAGDQEYAYIECSNGKKYSLTLSGAANIAGYISKDCYAFGNKDAASKAWEPLAKNMNMSVVDCAKKVLSFAAAKNSRVVENLIKIYGLDKSTLTFVGGGGGAATVVPHLAEYMNCKYKIAKNAQVISPIGVALAMVRDMVERTVSNPTDDDILSLRKEAIKKAIQSGADPNTIEVKVEVDSQHQKIRAIAIGSTELRTKELSSNKKSNDELIKIASESMHCTPNEVSMVADNGSVVALTCEKIVKKLYFFKKKLNTIRLVDRDGVIRLQRKNGIVVSCNADKWKNTINKLLYENTIHGDGGAEIPNIYIILDRRIIDLAGMQSEKQILSLAQVELSGTNAKDKLIIVCTKTAENERG